MTQEEKQLLLKDLCARLPYGVKLKYVEDLVVKKESHTITLNNIYLEHIINGDTDIKPYLRPLSSMTEEEAEQIIKFICGDSIGINKINIRQDHITAKVDYLIGDSETVTVWFDDIMQSIEIFDFLNAHHFDYRGLIPMGLALEAPEGMYNNKIK